MKKIILIFLILFPAISSAHTEHYKNIKKLEMEVFRNGKSIGFSNYKFFHDNENMKVMNNTEFEVELFGVIIFSIKGKSTEQYIKDQLVKFNSLTYQNDKKKFVNLVFNKNKNKFIINGSSFSGEADTKNIIGNWWNHKILESESQISPLSGSVKKQIVTFIKKENVDINGKIYECDHFKLQSKNKDLPPNKRLNFDIWYDKKDMLIRKVSYKRMGKWEYILINVK